jgi:probable HAF family extracellular repeat protein
MSLCKSSGLAIFAAACLVGETTGPALAQCDFLQCPTEWSDGSVIILVGNLGVAYGINAAGQVVGSTGHTPVPTEWSGGSVIIQESNGLGSGSASGINDAGQAVGGIFSAGAGPSFATKWSGGGVIILGGPLSNASGINDAGQVVGFSEYLDGVVAPHATVWSGGSEINLRGLPGSILSDALAINDAGQVVGFSQVGPFDYATKWRGDSIINLGGLPGSENSYADGINDRGQVVGFSDLTPPPPPITVPESSTWAMMLIGFAGLALVEPVWPDVRRQDP